jgi:hypothetical protein
MAPVQDEVAEVYEELTGAGPELADEHCAESERSRANATSSREYAELLWSKTTQSTSEY